MATEGRPNIKTELEDILKISREMNQSLGSVGRRIAELLKETQLTEKIEADYSGFMELSKTWNSRRMEYGDRLFQAYDKGEIDDQDLDKIALKICESNNQLRGSIFLAFLIFLHWAMIRGESEKSREIQDDYETLIEKSGDIQKGLQDYIG